MSNAEVLALFQALQEDLRETREDMKQVMAHLNESKGRAVEIEKRATSRSAWVAVAITTIGGLLSSVAPAVFQAKK